MPVTSPSRRTICFCSCGRNFWRSARVQPRYDDWRAHASGGMTGMPVCDAVVVSKDNRFLLAAYENAVEVFSIGANGVLTRITPVSAFPTNNAGGGSGAHSMALHPNGLTLYTANLNSNTVSVFGVNTNTGVLTELQSPPISTGANPNFVAIHPNGSFLFTADATPTGQSEPICDQCRWDVGDASDHHS